MIKNAVLALVAVASITAVTLPATYANASVFGSGDSDSQEWAAGNILNRLNEQGVNATAVESWGGLVRAYVTLEDGSRVMQFFTPDSLQPVTL